MMIIFIFPVVEQSTTYINQTFIAMQITCFLYIFVEIQVAKVIPIVEKKGNYKYTKGFCHEGRLHQHISSSIECEKVYKSQGLVFFKGIEKKKYLI